MHVFVGGGGVSHNYRMICCKMGYRTDISGINKSTKGGIVIFFGELLTSLKKVSRDTGYRSDSVAVLRDMGTTKSPRCALDHTRL